jgi:indole-3-glycerol phosphate synthase
MLDQIVASVEARLPAVIGAAEALESAARSASPARDFAAALTAHGLSVIAEIKRRSPSRGPIDMDLVPSAQAAAYEAGGAAALSVLTEGDHFSGSLDDLRAAREAVGVPVLRKDFILHPAQVWESRAAGADAILLIVAILDDASLETLLAVAREAGVAALVEAHTAAEAERAVAAGAEIIGINNRNLTTFQVDLSTADALRPMLGTAIKVAESGVSDADGAARMAAAGYDAILVGEAAVRAADPGAFIAGLRVAT